MAAVATAGGAAASDHLLTNIQRTIAGLFNNKRFSDITIIVEGQSIYAHRLVLQSRGQWVPGGDLSALYDPDGCLELEGISHATAVAVLKWVYTDELDHGSSLSSEDVDFLLTLMRAAAQFVLPTLKTKCGHLLMPAVNVKTCIRIVTVAHELGADELKAFAADMLVQRWEEIDPTEFGSLNADLLYEMLKTKTQFPLHRAVMHCREDVVFRFLLDFDMQLHVKVNELDETGSSPLFLALKAKNESIANTLVSHQAMIDAVNGDGVRLLHAAINSGDTFAAIFLISNGADVNFCAEDARSPLHIAADTNLVDVGLKLIASGARVNAVDDSGNTPIQRAIISGNTEMVELFLATPSVDVNTRNKDGHTALWLALALPTQDVARALVEGHGCDINIVTSSGDSMLHAAIQQGLAKSALFLIECGASTDLANERRETPLHKACSSGLTDVVDALLAKRAVLNAQDSELRTPLMLAIINGRKEVIQRLLSQERVDGSRLEVNLRASSGDCALGLALAAGLLDVAEWLIQGGADIESPNEGSTLLCQSIQRSDAQAALFLLERNANVQSSTADGTPALNHSIIQDMEDVCFKLCALGADVNAMDAASTTPLWLALKQKKEKIAFILVRHQCDLNFLSREGVPALHRAIADKDMFAATFLIRNGANVNIPTTEADQHNFPIHAATKAGLIKVVTALMQHKADVNRPNDAGSTAAHVAVESKQAEVLDALLKHPQLNLKARDKEELTAFGKAIMTRQLDFAMQIMQREPGAADEPNAQGMGMLHTVISKSDADSIQLLLKCKVNINKPTSDASARTPLSLAVERGDEPIVKMLIKAGADHRVPDRVSKWTVAHVAASMGSVPILKMLMQVKADMNAIDDLGESVLHSAIRAGQTNVVKMLIDNKTSNMSASNRENQTPLHILAIGGKDSATEVLSILFPMVKGNLDPQDAYGKTPLHYAFRNGSSKLAKALVANGAQPAIADNDGNSIFNMKSAADDKLLYRLLASIPAPPPWQEAKMCQLCSLKFGTTHRKHHCRLSGLAVCKKCSSKSHPIPQFGMKKNQRVCDPCYLVLSGEIGSLSEPKRRIDPKATASRRNDGDVASGRSSVKQGGGTASGRPQQPTSERPHIKHGGTGERSQQPRRGDEVSGNPNHGRGAPTGNRQGNSGESESVRRPPLSRGEPNDNHSFGTSGPRGANYGNQQFQRGGTAGRSGQMDGNMGGGPVGRSMSADSIDVNMGGGPIGRSMTVDSGNDVVTDTFGPSSRAAAPTQRRASQPGYMSSGGGWDGNGGGPKDQGTPFSGVGGGGRNGHGSVGSRVNDAGGPPSWAAAQDGMSSRGPQGVGAPSRAGVPNWAQPANSGGGGNGAPRGAVPAWAAKQNGSQRGKPDWA